MTNLMDPDGTNRIVKQRVSEWYAERDRDRTASLLDSDSEAARPSIVLPIRRFVADAIGRLRSLRQGRSSDGNVIEPPVAGSVPRI